MVARTFLFAAHAALAMPHLAQVERQVMLNGHADGAVAFPAAVPVGGFDGSISVCGDNSDTFHPTTLAMSPDPPQRGQPLDVTVIGELDRRVEDGAYIKVVAKLGLVKLFQHANQGNLDLCEESGKIGKPCPIEAGHQEVYHTVDKFPRELPPGTYDVEARVFHGDGQQMSCVHVRFKL
ncbi:Phosphatidylglycerol/phosphatidylinositol transfer protein [Entophlyctis luteolus]|nr:Phosphatidylglycerol/phosphatidylinositol transfer protein [Entophlyctis luteolus]KAJ3357405.1 Phosphatidylglycerol/phosphatidylinositol transfer protein [Entophlyctis luteolus]